MGDLGDVPSPSQRRVAFYASADRDDLSTTVSFFAVIIEKNREKMLQQQVDQIYYVVLCWVTAPL